MLNRLLRLIGLGLFLGGIARGAYALLRWLQTGLNDPPVLNQVVYPLLPAGTLNWLMNPSSWFGLRYVLVWALDIPIFAWMILAGIVVLLVAPPSRR